MLLFKRRQHDKGILAEDKATTFQCIFLIQLFHISFCYWRLWSSPQYCLFPFFQTFDLKGSMRSRYVQTSGMNNDVLLDENLLESELLSLTISFTHL